MSCNCYLVVVHFNVAFLQKVSGTFSILSYSLYLSFLAYFKFAIARRLYQNKLIVTADVLLGI